VRFRAMLIFKRILLLSLIMNVYSKNLKNIKKYSPMVHTNVRYFSRFLNVLTRESYAYYYFYYEKHISYYYIIDIHMSIISFNV
jgi:hypothetical protein